MYITPPKVSASLQSGVTGTPNVSGPTTTSGPGTLGQYLAVVTPAGSPGTLAATLSGAASIILFGLGWSRMGSRLARSKMASSSPADKSALWQNRLQGIVAESLFGGALYLASDDVKPWVFVGGLPIAAWFLPGLIRHSWIPFMGPSQDQVSREQNKRRKSQQKQSQRRQQQAIRKGGGVAPRPARPRVHPSVRSAPMQEEEIYYEEQQAPPPRPSRLSRQRGRRRIPSS